MIGARLAVLAALGAGGCAGLFGLDETHLAGDDDIDAWGGDGGVLPPCDVELTCAGAMCGRIRDLYSGQPVADTNAIDPTACTDGASNPPCTYQVWLADAYDLGARFGDATLDSCGRWILPQISSEAAAIVVLEPDGWLNATVIGAVEMQYRNWERMLAYSGSRQAFGDASGYHLVRRLTAGTDADYYPNQDIQFMFGGILLTPGQNIYYFADQEPHSHNAFDEALQATGVNGSGFTPPPSSTGSQNFATTSGCDLPYYPTGNDGAFRIVHLVCD